MLGASPGQAWGQALARRLRAAAGERPPRGPCLGSAISGRRLAGVAPVAMLFLGS